MRHLYVSPLLARLTGRPGSPMRLSMMSAQELAQADDYMLCRAFAVAHAQKAREELVRRHLFTLDEWWLIEKQQIVVGTKKPGCAEIPVR